MNKLLSIVICTYNRADVLDYALQSLTEQTAENESFDVIVVDNNSTDNTKAVYEKYEKQLPNLKYVFETKQGLSHARNAGYKNTNTPYVGYIDDDAKANKNYVKFALDTIKTHKPDIFGGPIFPYYLTEKPTWFKDEYDYHGVFDENGWITNKSLHLAGSNIIFRTQLLHNLSGFDPNFGMQGDKFNYGEEVKLQDIARQKNATIYYNKSLIIKHLTPKYKLTLPFYLMNSFEIGKYFYYDKIINNNNFLNTINENDVSFEYNKQIEIFFNELKSLINNYRKNALNQPMEQVFVEQICRKHAFNLGYLHELKKHVKPHQNSFWNKVYKLNLETIITKIKKLF